MGHASICALQALGLLGLLSFPAGLSADDVPFLRGDVNADGRVSISDVLMIRRYLFNGDSAPPCMAAADVDDITPVDLTDAVLLVQHLFLSVEDLPPLSAPFPELGADPTPDPFMPCDSYDVVPVQETDDLVRIGELTAVPGQEVKVPVYLSSQVEVEAVQLVVRYDPALFTPRTGRGLDFNGTPWQGLVVDMHHVSVDPDGFMVLDAMGSLTGMIGDNLAPYPPIPAGTDTLIFSINGKVSASASPGTQIVLEPWNGPQGQGVHAPYFLRNEISHKGEARFVSFQPRLQAGKVGIVDDITLFIRGDANSDGLVDISDPIFTLDFLYSGGKAPVCLDAADADDNGILEVTDPVVMLGQLFTGTARIAAPFPSAGLDPTPDSFDSCPKATS